MQRYKILVVEDFEPLRRVICSTLQQREDFQVNGEAGDGLEAIQKSEELQPDLILLDISLPKLNGIEAARRIGKVAPKAKILFLTQNTSRDVATAALSTGASGYIVKSHAGEVLFEALEAVSQGKRFVSGGIEAGISK